MSWRLARRAKKRAVARSSRKGYRAEGVKRPELEKAIDAFGPGDVLVLAE